LKNSIVQLKKRTSPLAIEKSPTAMGIEHLPLPPDSDVFAAEANLASVRAHDKSTTQGDGAAAIGGITVTMISAGSFKPSNATTVANVNGAA
jgi:hypothetical protein